MSQIYYVGADHFATGEGRTLSLLITTAQSDQEALDKFRAKFGEYFSIGARTWGKDEFFAQWGHYVPDALNQRIHAGNCMWSMQFHLNLS
jgi:hypothetical protein